MSTALIIIIAAVVVVVLLAIVISGRRRRVVKHEENRLEERRDRALDTRREAAEHQATADQLVREADLHEERAREAEAELAKRGH
jgi:uncharacterized membrane protein